MSDSKIQSIPPLTPTEALRYTTIIDEAVENYRGQADELENAIGMLMIGRIYGWKVLVIVHNKRTIKKYESILGINIREMFPPEGPLAHKSLGYRIASKLSNFWKAVSGDIKIENRREIGPE
ncbi:hypothetical protein SAMN05216302_10726 [Nitrosomonas aestuarii]|uniref:Uncharacterized protein n=1 Tax=Nitrosomonas aestuarii TaxID=52441 RepID=A0A1I4H832_9PROT|nr:hypothetical protein [Nitrosomonas aestuarii]SFL37823.1 hypothetical protein SAMN05216302_10726 [Nitrosomonas aestuarii]